MNLANEKATLRKRQLELRQNFSVELQARFSFQICQQLEYQLQSFAKPVVHAYWPMPGEVNIKPVLAFVLERGGKVVLPKVLGNRNMVPLVYHPSEGLEAGPFGTQHPKSGTEHMGEIDVFIIPGLAFDRNRNRLGYGAGFFDTFLEKYKESHKIGVGFPFQIVEKVPHEPHDIPMDELIFPD